MDEHLLENLGLSKNESKIYFALIQKKEATASELIKATGFHRGVVYDNIERLIDKGLASFVVKGVKKVFVAEEPESIIDFLNSKKQMIDDEIASARKILPEISKHLSSIPEDDSEARVFRGVKGIKKVLSEVLNSKENWCLGMTNESTDILTPNFWKNYNVKINDYKIRQRFLLNADFDDIYGFSKNKDTSFRRLPKELNQMTEIMLFDDKVAMFVYSKNPVAIILKDKNLSKTFRQHFELLWKISK